MPASENAPPAHDHVKISLVVATFGRRDELVRLLESLCLQTLLPHEIIIVDQNPEGWLAPSLAPFVIRLPLRHLRSAKGLSIARNVGLQAATGQLINFPDDDCWMHADLLQKVAHRFAADPVLDALSVPLADKHDRPIMLRWPSAEIAITRHNVWQTCLAAGFFARRDALIAIGGFDEKLGVGASSGLASGEETDLALRMLEAGMHLEFQPIAGLHHPARPPATEVAARAAGYGRGFGYVWTLHRLPAWAFHYYCLRAAAGYGLARLKGDHGAARYYAASLAGRRAGRAEALRTRA